MEVQAYVALFSSLKSHCKGKHILYFIEHILSNSYNPKGHQVRITVTKISNK